MHLIPTFYRKIDTFSLVFFARQLFYLKVEAGK
jgi:hypothetical protein